MVSDAFGNKGENQNSPLPGPVHQALHIAVPAPLEGPQEPANNDMLTSIKEVIFTLIHAYLIFVVGFL